MKTATDGMVTITRRGMISALAATVAGMTAGCAPVRILMHVYPDEFDGNPGRVDHILRVFVATLVPGVDPDGANLVRAFYDDYFPLAPHRNFLAAELCNRSATICGSTAFEQMEQSHRNEVIESALAAGGPVGQLFTGAVFLSQVSVYSGIYDSAAGCSLIDFDGFYRMRPLAQTSYPEPERFLAATTCVDGHPS